MSYDKIKQGELTQDERYHILSAGIFLWGRGQFDLSLQLRDYVNRLDHQEVARNHLQLDRMKTARATTVNCDHVMGTCFYNVYHSNLESYPSLSKTMKRFSYCPLCGTKLAPIFAALEPPK